VNSAKRPIDSPDRVFGVARLRMIPGCDGKIAQGEIRIGDTVIMSPTQLKAGQLPQVTCITSRTLTEPLNEPLLQEHQL
jgi:hypothetical protein